MSGTFLARIALFLSVAANLRRTALPLDGEDGPKSLDEYGPACDRLGDVEPVEPFGIHGLGRLRVRRPGGARETGLQRPRLGPAGQDGRIGRDRHIEITSRRSSPVGECVVVEIPPPENSALCDIARTSLNDHIAVGGATMDSGGT
jgi:hypothetical protein